MIYIAPKSMKMRVQNPSNTLPRLPSYYIIVRHAINYNIYNVYHKTRGSAVAEGQCDTHHLTPSHISKRSIYGDDSNISLNSSPRPIIRHISFLPRGAASMRSLTSATPQLFKLKFLLKLLTDFLKNLHAYRGP